MRSAVRPPAGDSDLTDFDDYLSATFSAWLHPP
jgi:hypothetical protein